MALQQVSMGGAASPVAPVDLTSLQQTGQSQTNTGGLNYQQYLSDIADTPFPVVPKTLGTPQSYTPPAPTANAPLTGALPTTSQPPPTPASPNIQIDPFTQGVSSEQATGFTGAWPGAVTIPGNPYAWDPFSFAGAGEGAALQSEQSSPGYQQFGQTWLDLLNTIGTQNLQWGGTNQFPGELKGGGSVGPWLSQYILTPYNNGNQNDALANAIYFISSQTGKPASDPETQKLGGAFLDYTLQNSNRYGANTANFKQRRAAESGGLFGGIFGDILGPVSAIVDILQPELIPLTAALNAGIDLSQGNYLGAGLAGLAGLGGGLSDFADVGTGLSDATGLTNTVDEGLFNVANTGDISLLSDLGTAGQIATAAGMAGGVGQALSQGNYIGALGPAIGLGSAAINALPSGSLGGTSGSNAGESGGVLSSVANSLGLTPDQLISYAGNGLSLGGSAVPLLQQATAGGSPTLNVSAPLPAPTATQTASPAPTPNLAGQPLTAQALANPSQATYQQPGPRQANPQQLAAILAALGVAA